MENKNNNPRITTRLMITKMILENFKSYAGVQEIGPFHKRFSSIVGPNGSGKSNVIDALLFVFGKRAKQLRLNKVSELIHKSSGFPNLDSARVAVHFQMIHDNEDSEDDFEVVTGSEFIITRTAKRDNSSKYTVDGKSSTYTEVGTMLKSYGIDLDNNRFLILQGEVEQIAMMKPKAATPHEEGLLEYLEDIIGSSRFIEKIDEISKQLEALNEQRIEKVNRLKLAEKERDNLSGSKEDAEIFIEKEKDIRRKKNILYQLHEHIAKKNITDLNERRQKAQEKLEYEKAKLATNESKCSETTKVYEVTLAEHNALELEVQKTTNSFAAFERRDVKLQEDMKHCNAQISKLKVTISKDQKREEECAKDADQALTQIDAARKALQDIRARKMEEETQLEAIMEGLQGATVALRENLEGAQSKLADAERSIAGLQTDKEAIMTSIQLLNSRAENAMKQMQATEDKLHKISVEKAALHSSIASSDKDNAALVARAKVLSGLIDAKEQEEVSLQGAVHAALTAAEEAKATYSAQQSSGKNGTVANILKAARKGGPLANAGVRGRLGDLGNIPAEYDVAVSTACGLLDYVVVDTTEGGQACIEYLRRGNVGRANFIVLEQMVQWKAQMERAVSTPEGTPRLFDLVTVKEAAFKAAFYMALRDTLVAKDLDSAVRVAYVGDKAQWRVVTLDGNLIDTSGAMSGGGKEVRSGAMALQSGARIASVTPSDEDISPTKVQELEEKVAKLHAQLIDVRNAKYTAEKELKEVAHKIKTLPTEIEKMHMALQKCGEQASDLQQRLVAIQSETQLSAAEKKELAALQQKLLGIEESIQAASPNMGPLRSEVSMLQRKILDVGGPKLAKAQSKVDALAAQYDNLSSQLSTREVEESSNRKQAVKAGAARAKGEQDMQKFAEKLNGLMAEQKEMEADALAVIQDMEAAKEKMEQQKELLRSMTKEYKEVKEALEKIRRVELDLLQAIEDMNKEIKENSHLASKWHKDVETVREKHVEEQKDLNATIKTALSSSLASVTAAEASAVNDDDIETLPVLTAHILDAALGDIEEIKREINVLEAAREKLKKDVNMSALLEYLKKDAMYKSRLCELEVITEERNTSRRAYEDLRRQRLEEFMAGFGIITLKLKEMYQMITLGGDAELELVDSLDPFSEGIVFSVRPPKKSWKNISNLSGGEKTLSSLSLVFALHHFKPTPLYVMDEIDAALDFKNVSIVANYIKERTKNAQFVILSLRNNMFELADRLVGIYKTHDTTKSVTINPKTFNQNIEGGKSTSGNAVPLSSQRVLNDATNRM